MRRASIFLPILLCLAACVAGPDRPIASGSSSAVKRPRARSSGPRLPPTSGVSPAARGWVKVGDLLWVEAADAPTWDGIVRGRPDADTGGARLVLRTDHVSLRTDLPARRGVELARLAETHVRALFAEFETALDLYFPHEPLPVEVHTQRASFQQALLDAAPGHPGWGAFYDARHGTVHVCFEPAPRAVLPLHADLRHEMTHQVLDLSTPARGRSRIFQGHYLWLWEGFAAWTETLGDGPRVGVSPLRQERFDVRRSRNEVAPLATLFRLDQSAFEGRHYDQCAVLLGFLMRGASPRGRQAVLASLAAVLRGTARPDDFERRLGMSTAALDAAWRRTW